MNKHRKSGAIGTFTVHAPADYRPTHLMVGQWADRVTGRTTDLVFVPPEDLVFVPMANGEPTSEWMECW